jgi:hypothetical protein
VRTIKGNKFDIKTGILKHVSQHCGKVELKERVLLSMGLQDLESLLFGCEAFPFLTTNQ